MNRKEDLESCADRILQEDIEKIVNSNIPMEQGESVILSIGRRTNFKITTAEDMKMFQAMLNTKEKVRNNENEVQKSKKARSAQKQNQ